MKRFLFYFFSIIFVFQIYSIEGQEETKPKILPSRIAIIGCHDPGYEHIGIYAHASKLSYALKHGYGVHLYTEYLDKERLGYWYKLIAVQRHLQDYDWVFYLDSDALIMNEEIKLESLIDDNYDFIGNFGIVILSGQFLIKNTEWSINFLRDWYAIGHTNIQPGFDGGALIKLCMDDPSVYDHMKFIPIRELGSYYNDYQEGDFVIQFAGLTHSDKARLMKEYYELSKLKKKE